jgi:RimJ/RimL family protein N-acetyltransferase
MNVTLREPAADDVDWVFETCQDPDIQRYTTVPVPYLREHAEGWVANVLGELSRELICDAATGERLAAIGVRRHDDDPDVYEVGYWAAPAGRGRGAVSAAVREIQRRLGSEYGARLVDARILPDNAGSRRVAERCGFVLDEADDAVCAQRGAEVRALRYVWQPRS